MNSDFRWKVHGKEFQLDVTRYFERHYDELLFLLSVPEHSV